MNDKLFYEEVAEGTEHVSSGRTVTEADVVNFAGLSADFNKDGVVDLYKEMTYGHAYYASAFDRGGKTDYLKTVTKAFIDGRKIITNANGEKLSSSDLTKVQDLAQVICSNWAQVLSLIHI